MGAAHLGHLEHHLQKYPPSNLLSKIYRKVKWYKTGSFLFLPPLAFVVFCGVVLLCHLGLGTCHLVTFVVTMVTFGIVNDYVHDATHIEGHFFERMTWFRRLRIKHMVHHRDMKRNYGIVFFGWDRLFGTYDKG